MEPVTVQLDTMELCAKISAVKELLETAAQEHVTAQLASIAITLVENVSSVQMTHLERNVRRLVNAVRMELPSALMLMEDVSVKQTGLDQDAILTVRLAFMKGNVLST